jgi:hypothetical protein
MDRFPASFQKRKLFFDFFTCGQFGCGVGGARQRDRVFDRPRFQSVFGAEQHAPNVNNVFVMTTVISLQLSELTSLPYAQNPKTD